MNNKNKIFLILLLLVNGILMAQETYSFFVEIPNKSYLPIVTHARNGNRKAYVKTRNIKLNTLLNSYKVFSCKKVFTKSKKESLQNIYLIECNSPELKDDLINAFGQIYPRIESAQGETLAIPNDYGLNGGFLESQIELDYIRAPEAWDISTGSKNIIIGIADSNFTPSHDDLENTLDIVVNSSSNSLTNNQHGSTVSSYAAAETNNGKGISAIGYNSYIYAGVDANMAILDELSQLEGVKIVNASWLIPGTTSLSGVPNSSASFYEPVIDDIINERNVVVIAAAGNGEKKPGNPNAYVYPASYKDVISVSTIGHNNRSWWNTFESFLDGHEFLKNGEIQSYQHNDSIDIVAPGYGMVGISLWEGTNFADDAYAFGHAGTSYSAPIVAGTVSLMFDVNYCIDPKEVETILKLTAVKIDTLPQNIQYYGKLGAGKLDAYEAVKMADDMAKPFGTVEVKDRILYRPWFYKLETAPYEIKMTNNDVTGGSKLKFKARNNIEVLSGDYYPDNGGYMDLSIDATLAIDCPPAPINNSGSSSKRPKTKGNTIEGNALEISSNNDLLVFPNPTTGTLNIVNKEDLNEIVISDITGKTVYYMKDINKKELLVNMSKFNSGMYFVEIIMKSGQTISRKIIKQ